MRAPLPGGGEEEELGEEDEEGGVLGVEAAGGHQEVEELAGPGGSIQETEEGEVGEEDQEPGQLVCPAVLAVPEVEGADGQQEGSEQPGGRSQQAASEEREDQDGEGAEDGREEAGKEGGGSEREEEVDQEVVEGGMLMRPAHGDEPGEREAAEEEGVALIQPERFPGEGGEAQGEGEGEEPGRSQPEPPGGKAGERDHRPAPACLLLSLQDSLGHPPSFATL
jgi:hypothetical protein